MLRESYQIILGTYLAASFNPFHCDEKMAWFVQNIDQRKDRARELYWFGNFKIQTIFMRKMYCATPQSFAGYKMEMVIREITRNKTENNGKSYLSHVQR